VGGAVGDQHIVTLDLHAQAGKPAYRGLAVALETGDGPVGMDPRLLLFHGQLGAGVAPDALMHLGVQDAGDGEVDQGTLGQVDDVIRHTVAHAPADETATADLATHQALAFQLLVGIGHGLHADAQGIGYLALRWQALVMYQYAALDLAGDGLHQDLVFGLADAGGVQGCLPTVHHDVRFTCRGQGHSIPCTCAPGNCPSAMPSPFQLLYARPKVELPLPGSFEQTTHPAFAVLLHCLLTQSRRRRFL